MTDRTKFNTFLSNYPETNLAKDANGNYTGDLDNTLPLGANVTQVGVDAYNADPTHTTNSAAADISANETAMVYFLSAYNTGITLLKKDASGNFTPLHFTSSSQNGTIIYSTSPCN